MKVVIVVKEKESNERAISRFNKTVQSSRKILKVRTSRYHVKPKTRRRMRQAAVMRDFHRARRAKSRFY